MIDPLEYEPILFIGGVTQPRSVLVLCNAQALCAQHLAGRYALEVVDVRQHPARAEAEDLLGIPCLIKKRPGLVRRLVGDLSDSPRVLRALGLA